MKKIVKMFLATALLVATTRVSYSQTQEQKHATLTKYYNKAKEDAEAIYNGSSKTKDEQISHAKEVEKNLEAAKKTHADLKRNMPEKQRIAAKLYHEEIEKYQKDASRHLKALYEELDKPLSAEIVINDQGKKLCVSLNKAEREHQKLVEKISM